MTHLQFPGHKYHAKRTEYNGYFYDSRKEAGFGLESRDGFNWVIGVVGKRVVAVLAEGHPQIGRIEYAGIAGKQADDGVTEAVERDDASEYARIRAETALPETIRENDNRRAAGAVFGGKEKAPVGGFDAEHGK